MKYRNMMPIFHGRGNGSADETVQVYHNRVHTGLIGNAFLFFDFQGQPPDMVVAPVGAQKAWLG
jgi:hypothetical protein